MPTHAASTLHLYLDQPPALFRARINMPGAIIYPVTELTFDGVTLGTYTVIQPDMTLTIGTTQDGDDLGRLRVRNLATSTAIPIGRVSRGIEDGTINIQDNAYVTVWDDWRVWAKLPYADSDGNTFKDGIIAVGDYQTEIPPKANVGPGFAGYISGGIITVSFDGSGSYAMAEGATITTYAWGVEDGTITVGTSASAAITATFPAGRRWVGLTVTDSNGKQHSARCPVVAIDPADDDTVQFQIESRRLTQNGQELAVRILEDVPRSAFPDGGLVLMWEGAAASASDRSHMRFIGWEQSHNAEVRATRGGNLRGTVLHCLDVAGRLEVLPAFPQALERNATPDIWMEMADLDINRALYYLLFWHTTAVALADLVLAPEGDEYPAMRLDSTGGTLFDQVRTRAGSMIPDHIFACDEQGRLSVLPDWMLQDTGDRPSVVLTLAEDDWSEFTVEYRRAPRVHVLRSSAVLCSTDWLMLGGEETLPLGFCIAPGDSFSQGTNEATTGEKLARSQDELEACEGHRYARLNNRYGLFRISLAHVDDLASLMPADLPRVTFNVSATTAAQRGLDFTSANGLVKELELRYHHERGGTWVEAVIGWEKETSGFPAITVVPEVPSNPPDFETPAPLPDTVPPGFVEGEELIAGIDLDGNVYRTADFQTPSGSGGPTWTQHSTGITEAIYSFIVDPFSPKYISGTGTVDGWVATETDIYRLSDLFGTVAATSVLTFPVANDAASFHWRSIMASFGAYFEASNPWLVCVSYYGDTASHEGTWATYSTDAGATWSDEVQLSAVFDNSLVRFAPIGVYASPKTPGLAYAVAYSQAADPDKLPSWALYSDGTHVTTLTSRVSASVSVASAGSPNSSAIVVAPPANATKLKFTVAWSVTHDDQSGILNITTNLSPSQGANVSTTGGASSNFSAPGANQSGTNSGSYAPWRTLVSGVWAVDKDNIGTPPTFSSGSDTTPSSNSASWHLRTDAQGSPNSSSASITITLTEITFDDLSVYSPPSSTIAVVYRTTDWGATWEQVTSGNGYMEPGYILAGSIHIPWPDNAAESLAYYGNADFSANREYRLYKSEAGTLTDISPVDTGVSFGVNREPFTIRAYDSDRQYLLMSGVGNDASADPADDTHGVFYSDDAGATWTTIVTPIAGSGAPSGRAAFEAAFSGTDPAVLYIWGPAEYISYSDDAGATVDDRSGDLGTFSPSGFIGIVGGSV